MNLIFLVSSKRIVHRFANGWQGNFVTLKTTWKAMQPFLRGSNELNPINVWRNDSYLPGNESISFPLGKGSYLQKMPWKQKGYVKPSPGRAHKILGFFTPISWHTFASPTVGVVFSKSKVGCFWSGVGKKNGHVPPVLRCFLTVWRRLVSPKAQKKWVRGLRGVSCVMSLFLFGGGFSTWPGVSGLKLMVIYLPFCGCLDV